ncbi:MAG: CvpA family protein [candidate division WOR-3 bacterium]
MSGVDIIVILIIAFGLISGLRSGFISELIALFSLLIGVFLAFKFYTILMPYLKNEIFSIFGMFILIYFSSQFILSMIFKPFKIIVGGTVVNRILGALLGALEMTLFISVIAYGLRYSEIYSQFTQNSQVLKQIENITFPIYNSLFKE